MEPLSDDELNQLLHQWKAPDAPASLERKVVPGGTPWWRWLISGSIRIPVPVGVAIVVALALWVYFRGSAQAPPQLPAKAVSLADFQPVKQLEPRVIGRAKNEGN